MVLDHIQQDQSGPLASDEIPDFSVMLAADPMSHQVPEHVAIGTRANVGQHGLNSRLVRLLLNPSMTLYSANAALQALAWVSILCHQIDASA